jgi:hypothetical protein
LNTWLDRSSSDYMFSPSQIKTWTSTHLRGVGWYLEYGPLHVHEVEAKLFRFLESFGRNVVINGQFSDLDLESPQKTFDRLKIEDLKKVETVKDALEKT